MVDDVFRGHAERARRGQWNLEELPWDEPIELCGASKRERLMCKLDMIELANAMYHFQLGARIRMGDQLVRAWPPAEHLADCMEWHDLDEQRHVRGLRKLLARLAASGDPVPPRNEHQDPARLWSVTYSSRERLDADRVLMNMLVDESVAQALFELVAKLGHVPLVRALFDACAQDDARHFGYLVDLARQRFDARAPRLLPVLQARVVAHVANLQSAFRPHLGAFAGASHSSRENVASGIFRAASRALGDIGPEWQRGAVTRLVHSADRSPWLVWLLR
jgi:hypothetical protein